MAAITLLSIDTKGTLQRHSKCAPPYMKWLKTLVLAAIRFVLSDIFTTLRAEERQRLLHVRKASSTPPCKRVFAGLKS